MRFYGGDAEYWLALPSGFVEQLAECIAKIRAEETLTMVTALTITGSGEVKDRRNLLRALQKTAGLYRPERASTPIEHAARLAAMGIGVAAND